MTAQEAEAKTKRDFEASEARHGVVVAQVHPLKLGEARDGRRESPQPTVPQAQHLRHSNAQGLLHHASGLLGSARGRLAKAQHQQFRAQRLRRQTQHLQSKLKAATS